MQQFTCIIKSPEGLHARPAGMLVKCAQSCSSKVSISACGRTVDAKSIFNVMGLGVSHNDKISFELEGPSEKDDAIKMKTFCSKNI